MNPEAPATIDRVDVVRYHREFCALGGYQGCFTCDGNFRWYVNGAYGWRHRFYCDEHLPPEALALWAMQQIET